MAEQEHAIRIAVLEEQIRGMREQQQSHNRATQNRFDALDDKVDQLIGVMNRGKGAYAASLALAGIIGAVILKGLAVAGEIVGR